MDTELEKGIEQLDGRVVKITRDELPSGRRSVGQPRKRMRDNMKA